MKASRRILSILLAVLMILPVMAVIGCNKRYLAIDDAAPVADNVDNTPEVVDDDPVETEAETEAATEAKVETEADEPDDLDDAKAEGDAEPVTEITIDETYNIVYPAKSAYAKICAEAIKDKLGNNVGAVVADTADEQPNEILVGKTNRAESASVRSEYTRHNVYYDIVQVDTKLVVMAEGYLTLQYVEKAFNNIESFDKLSGNVASGNVIAAVDNIGKSMFERTAETDLRVFHWNMAAPLSLGSIYDINSNINRGEIIADIIIQLDPDIITTNEIYYGHQGNRLYNAVMTELSEYYTLLGDPELDGNTTEDSHYEKDNPETGDDAVVGAYKKGEISIPENILYKKSLNLTTKYWGWRYLSERTEEGGYVFYHGITTAVFNNGTKDFIVSVGHYGRATGDTKFASEQYAAIEYAAGKAGVNLDNTPTIVTGDMFTYNNRDNGATGYNYWVSKGYNDSQITATTNANSPDGCLGGDNRRHGTFHTQGVRVITGVSEDFVWYKNGLSALTFKVLVSEDIDDCSDHYPVMADLKFN